MLKPEDDKDTEDTSKNEDDSSSEDTDEEDSSSDEDTSENDDDSDDGEDDDGEEDISKKYFTDPNSLPKELRGAFKKMQGVFTKKMQTASAAIQKATAFDELAQNPAFRKWLDEQRNGVAKSSRRPSDEEDDDDDDNAPVTKKDLQAFMRSLSEKETNAMRDAEIRKEAAQFKKDTPDWEIYKDEMADILKLNPMLSYKQAYRLASEEDTTNDRRAALLKAKKNANVNKPNKSDVKDIPEKKTKIKTIWDALALTKKQLKIKD